MVTTMAACGAAGLRLAGQPPERAGWAACHVTSSSLGIAASISHSVHCHSPKKACKAAWTGVTRPAGRAVQEPASLAAAVGDTAGRLLDGRLQHADVAVTMHKHNLVKPHLSISPPEGCHDACALVKLQICRHRAWLTRMLRQWQSASRTLRVTP